MFSGPAQGCEGEGNRKGRIAGGMSQEIGPALPPPLRFELGAHPAGGIPKAVLLLTIDSDGAPRVAVLAAPEITVRDQTHIEFGINASSSTHHNLQRSRKAALWYVLDAAAYCIRGEAKHIAANQDGFESFEMTVTSVLKDFQPEAPMVSGPTFKRV
jgi:Pyridoxamine 5'-phosphate oxidase